MHPLFQTYEILEQVFTYLDHISLRHGRLVNSFWHSVIHQNPSLCTIYRQRLRLRKLRVLLLGANNVGKRSLIRRWCYTSTQAQKAYDPFFLRANGRLPQTDGEIWMVQINYFDGEGGLEALEKVLPDGKGRVGAYVLVYEVGSRYSIEEVSRWWRAEKLGEGEGAERREAAANGLTSSHLRQEGLRKAERDGTFLDAGVGPNLFRKIREEYALRRRRGFPTAGEKPVLLALIATKCDIPSEARVVGTSEGQNTGH